MEGQQASLVGLTGVVDHLVYKETLPLHTKTYNWHTGVIIWIDMSMEGSYGGHVCLRD